jgi:hypothetical protein
MQNSGTQFASALVDAAPLADLGATFQPPASGVGNVQISIATASTAQVLTLAIPGRHKGALPEISAPFAAHWTMGKDVTR